MATGIRLLSRRPVERKTAQYDVLLARVLFSRFSVLLKLVLFLSWTLASIITRSLAPLYVAIHIFLAIAVILFMQKYTITARAIPRASLFEDWKARLSSPHLVLVISLYLISGLLYQQAVWGPEPKTITLQFGPREIPPGLPRELVQHDITVFNAQWLYPTGYTAYLSLVMAGIYVGFDRNVVAFIPEEFRLGPLPRIQRRARGILTRALFLWIVTSISWPLIFFGIEFTHTTSNPRFLTLLTTPLRWSLLPLLWEISHGFFQTYISLGPIHHGRTISEISQDPNGSLAQGLQAKHGSLAQVMAWHELLLIAEQIPKRRQSLFNDADSDRIVWKLVYESYQSLLNTAIDNLDMSTKPKKKKAVENSNLKDLRINDGSISTHKLPELHTIHGKNVFFIEKPSVGVRLVEKLQDDMHSKGIEAQKKVTSAEHAFTHWKNHRVKLFLASPIGYPFRRTTARQLNILLPNADVLEIAMRSVGALMVDSIEDDTVGYVQTTVAQNLELLDKFLSLLQKQINKPPVHWTVENDEVDLSLLEDLGEDAQYAFALVADAFKPWFDNLKVSKRVRERENGLETLKENVLSPS